MDRFGYFGSCISLGGRKSDEAFSRMQKNSLVFTNWWNLRRRHDIDQRSSIQDKGEVGIALLLPYINC